MVEAFFYAGAGFNLGPVKGELLSLVSYDSSTGGQHGSLFAAGFGRYTGGFEVMRTWSPWHETWHPIGFANGHADFLPTTLGPLTVKSGDFGGLAEFDDDNGVLSVGGYFGITTKSSRAFGAGGYVNMTWGTCPGPSASSAECSAIGQRS